METLERLLRTVSRHANALWRAFYQRPSGDLGGRRWLAILLGASLATFVLSTNGQGQAVGADDPVGVEGGYDGYIRTGSGYDPYTGSVVREVTDFRVDGAVGKYGLHWTRTYHSRRTAAILPYLGPAFGTAGEWSHPYNWGLFGTYGETPWTVGYPDGRVLRFGPTTNAGDGLLHANGGGISDRLSIRSPQNGGIGQGTLYLGDGGQVLFQIDADVSGQLRGHVTAVRDPYGQTTSITDGYNDNGSLALKITEPAGRSIIAHYGAINGQVVIIFVYATNGLGQSYQGTHYLYDSYANLIGVQYEDGTQANYQYYGPLGHAQTFADVRYAGPLQEVEYQYQDGGDDFHTKVIKSESHNGVPVSSYDFQRRVETRGDGFQRTFVFSGYGVRQISDFLGSSETRTYDANGFLSGVTDRRAATTTYTRELLIGSITAVTHPDGSSRAYAYTSATMPYFVATMVDERGFKTSYDRDALNRVQAIAYPDGSAEAFSYNGFGELTSHRHRDGSTATFAYDARGVMTSSTDPLGNVTHYTHDVRDRLVAIDDANHHRTAFTYNSRGATTQIAFADGTTEQFQYGGHGELLNLTNGLGKSWVFTYDDYLRVTSSADPYGRTWRYAYQRPNQSAYAHTTGNWSTETFASGTQNLRLYDGNFRLLTAISAAGTPDAALEGFGYDANGNQVSLTDANGRTWTCQYDARNRRVAQVEPAFGKARTWGYDARGQVVSAANELGQATTFQYDAMGCLTQVTDPNLHSTLYGYDPASRLVRRTDPNGNAYAWAYDGDDRPIQMTYPDQGTEAYAYDGVGNPVAYRDRAGNAWSFAYDARNRLVSRVLGNGQNDQGVSYAYDAVGHVIAVVNPYATVTRTYDDSGLLGSERQAPVGGPALSVAYANNADGQVASVQIAQRYGLTYAYNGRKEVASIQNPTGAPPYASYARDPVGKVLVRTQGDGSLNRFAYDADNRLVTLEDYEAGAPGPLLRSRYAYDFAGRLTGIQHDASGAQLGFGYDPAGQILAFSNSGRAMGAWAPEPPPDQQRYTYDKAGNRLNFTENGITGPDQVIRTLNDEQKRYSLSVFWNLEYLKTRIGEGWLPSQER